MIGLKIYKRPDDIDTFLTRISSIKVDTIFVGDGASEDLDLQLKLKNSGYNVYYILQTFYNPTYLELNPDSYSIREDGEKAIDEWVHFVCPTDPKYHRFLRKRVFSIINKYNPTGISIDFIRQFVFWEKVYNKKSKRLIRSCSCTRCKTDPRNSSQIISDVVKMLTNYARGLNSDIILDLHAVPWIKDEYEKDYSISGQNLGEISKYVDFITPMCYSHMLKKSPEWINEVVKDHFKQSKIDIVPAIQAKECYLEAPITDLEYKEILSCATKEPSKGVIIWNWDYIKNSTKYETTINFFKNF